MLGRTAPAGAELLGQDEVLAGALDELHRATEAPVTSRRPWLSTAARWSDGELFALATHGTQAAVVLSRRTVAGTTILAGPRPYADDRVRLHARSAAAGHRLCAALGRLLAAEPPPWRLCLATLDCDRLTALVLGGRIPGARVGSGRAIPGVALDRGPDPRAYLDKGMWRSVTRGRRHLDEDSREASVRFERDPRTIAARLPRLLELRARRDRQAGRGSERERGWWRELVAVHAGLGQLELGTLSIDGALAAYTVGFPDGAAYRVFDGRHDPGWGRYSPGRLLEAELLGHAARAGFAAVDWMSSVAPEALIAATHLESTVELTAAADVAALARSA